MTTALVLMLVLVFFTGNIALGIYIGAMFGLGPWRHSRAARFLSDPRLPCPAVFTRRRSSTAATLPDSKPS